MKNVFPQNLKEMRISKGLSMSSLGELVGVSKQAISKYEDGTSMPKDEVLVRLSKVFNVNLEAFFHQKGNTEIRLEKLSFRNAIDIAHYQSKIEPLTNSFLNRYCELEKIGNEEISFSNPLKDIIINNQQDAEKAAEILKAAWEIGQGPISSIIDMLERVGILVHSFYWSLEEEGFSGWFGEKPIVILNSRQSEITRRRFTALHELGHLVLKFETEDNDLIERLCDHFAGAMLISSSNLRTEIGEERNKLTINELITIKERYGISILSLLYRAAYLKIINWNKYHQLKEDYLFERNFGNYIGIEEPKRFDRLLFKLYNMDKISSEKAAIIKDINPIEMKNIFNEDKLIYDGSRL